MKQCAPRRDLTGEVFGRLTVLNDVGRRKWQCWQCRCSCGTERNFRPSVLLNGDARSCGTRMCRYEFVAVKVDRADSATHIHSRLWSRVNKSGPVPAYAPHLGPCWIWTGLLVNGYGRFSFGSDRTGTKREVLAYKYIYESLHGLVPQGLELDHLCRVRACCNPDHLDPVTHAENMKRSPLTNDGRLGAVHAAKTHCPNGHPYDEENTKVSTQRNGWAHRTCRACQRIRAAARRANARLAKPDDVLREREGERQHPASEGQAT